MSEPKKSEAKKTLEVIEGGKNQKLLELIPEGQSPKLYIELIKEQIMVPDKAGKPRRDEDLLLFLYVCKKTGLDPLAKQIHAVFRWNTRLGREAMTIQTGIDGMRLTAQRTKQYAGSDDITYFPEDQLAKYPTRATATVYKIIEGTKVGFTATARWAEYVQLDNKTKLPNDMWEKMPYNQLGKCAEALALRKGFPAELSGMYADEEMQQADNILAGLEAPERFNKEDKIEVVHGAPEIVEPVKEQKPLEIGTPEAKEQPKTPKKVEEPTVEHVEPDLGKMQEKLKEEQGEKKVIEGREGLINRVKESQEKAKAAGK